MVVVGYNVVYEVFLFGMSEFDINLVYLMVIGQCDIDVLYDNIVVLNEYLVVLYYIILQYQFLVEICSFLIDVGVEYNGYVVDLICIYVVGSKNIVDSKNDFVVLIKDFNNEQFELIKIFKCGVNYIEYNVQMYQCIVKLLCIYNLVMGISEEVMVE